VESDKLAERVDNHERYLFTGEESVRIRLHRYGNKITEHEGKIEDLEEWRSGVNRIVIGIAMGVPLGALPVLLELLLHGRG
jgi:hypothetical protein